MVVCIAIGNPLREDDGVARHALRLIEPGDQIYLFEVLQLLPELASEIASADLVFFLDADASAENTVLTPIETDSAHGSPLAHSMSPAELVAMSRDLFAFAGKALLCHIPAKHFGFGEAVSNEAETAARSAAQMVTEYLALHAQTPSRPAC